MKRMRMRENRKKKNETAKPFLFRYFSFFFEAASEDISCRRQVDAINWHRSNAMEFMVQSISSSCLPLT